MLLIRLRRFILLTLALAAMLAALLTVGVSYVTSQVPEYRQEVEKQLSKAFERPVNIETMRLVWRGVYPQAQVTGLTLAGDADGEKLPVTIRQLNLTLDPVMLMQGELKAVELKAEGAEVQWQLHRATETISLAEVRRLLVDMTKQLGTISKHLVLSVNDTNLLITSAKDSGFAERFTDISLDGLITPETVTLQGVGSMPDELGEYVYVDFEAQPPQQQGALIIDFGGLNADSEALLRLAEEWMVPLQGQLNLRARAAWQVDQLALTTDISVNDLVYQVSGSEGPQEVRSMQTRINALHNDDNWWLNTEGLSVTVEEIPWLEGDIELRGDGTGLITGKVDYARLDDVLTLVQPWLNAALPTAGGALRDITFSFQQRDAQDNPIGQLAATEPPPQSSTTTESTTSNTASVANAQDWHVWATADSLSLTDTEQTPGVSGINGQIELTPTSGLLVLQSDKIEFVEQEWFDQPLQFKQISGEVAWTLDTNTQQWQFTLTDLVSKNDLANFSGQGRFTLPRQSMVNPNSATTASELSPSQLDIAVDFADLNLPQLVNYLPMRRFSEEMQAWWPQALLAGQATGKVTLSGPLATFNIGETADLRLTADLREADVRFHPDWPVAKRVDGQLEWHNVSLQVMVDQLEIAGYPINNAVVAIPNFDNPYVDVAANLNGSPKPLLDAAQTLPIAKKVFARLAENDYRGAVNVQLAVHMPLDGQLDGFVDVNSRLRSVDIIEPDGNVYRDIHGELNVTHDGMSSRNLRGTVFDIPVRVQLQQNFTTQAVPTVTMQGELDLAAPAEGYQFLLEEADRLAITQHFSGAASWSGEVLFDDNQPEQVRININSDLVGMKSRLVGALGKTAEESKPLSVSVLQTGQGSRLVDLHLHNALTARLQWRSVPNNPDGELHKVAVWLGGQQQKPQLPANSEFLIYGQLDQFDLDQWDFFSGPDLSTDRFNNVQASVSQADADLPLSIKQLRINDFAALGFDFGTLVLDMALLLDSWQLNVFGDQVQGVLSGNINDNTASLVQGDFQRLWLPKQDLQAEPDNVAAVSESQPMARNNNVTPAQWPLLDLHFASVKLADFDFGELLLTHAPIATGSEFVLLADQADADLSGYMQWHHFQDQTQTTDVKFTLKTDEFDDLMEGLGLAENVTAEDVTFILRAGWDGQPFDVVADELYGTARFELTEGTLTQIDPGLGRIFGLLNFYQLPQRLTGDFRDMTEEGMAFDDMRGTFHFAEGNAYSSDLSINSALADAEFVGRIGLAAQDYDIHARVQPNLSGSVGVAGALIGGLSTGGVLVLVQELFKTPLQELTEIRYHLTGTWQEPDVGEIAVDSLHEETQVIKRPLGDN